MLFCTVILLTIPPTNFLTPHILSQEVQLLYTSCFLAQSRALVMHTTEKIIFYPEKNQYKINNRVYTLNSGVCFGTPAGTMGPHAKSPITFPEDTILFYPDGKTNAGSVYLSTIDYSAAYALTIGVGHTARVRIYRYINNQWVLMS